jgi:hypothetical protein
MTEKQRKFAAKPTYGDLAETVDFAKAGVRRIETSRDRLVPIEKGGSYGLCGSDTSFFDYISP